MKPLVVIEEFMFVCSSFSQETEKDESKSAHSDIINSPHQLISILGDNDYWARWCVFQNLIRNAIFNF